MKLLKKLIFGLIGFFIRLNNKIHERKSGDVKLYKLSNEHIQNLKILLDREELLSFLPKNGVVAELGVDEGEFSQKILDINLPQKLILIDAYETKRYSLKKLELIKNKFSKQIKDGKVEIRKGYSTDFASYFPDEFFDWIYIDTNHTYQTTMRELLLYSEKIKRNGFICGHDYVLGNWKAHGKYGVIEAVREFCALNNWEFVYLTFEEHNHHSFCIRKL